MERRNFLSLSSLGALSVVSSHAESSEPNTLESWGNRYLSCGKVLRTTPEKLGDQVERLVRISGNPVRAKGSQLLVQQNGLEHKIKIHLYL